MKKLEDRFWPKVLVSDSKSCWEWKANKNNKGYGMIREGGVKPKVLAHRVAYELKYGKIPRGLIVMHSCDNPSCCNPEHLSLGTMMDNTLDMISKGRKNIGFNPENRPPRYEGERHPRATITEDLAREIKFSKEPRAKLIERLNVSVHIVKSIRSGRTWKHL